MDTAFFAALHLQEVVIMAAHLNWRIVSRLLAFIIFLLLLFQLICHATYLFRNTSPVNRQRLVSLKSEPADTIDIILFGGSNIYMFWDTMYAWDTYGVTSFDYAVDSAAAGTILNSLEEISEKQDLKLVIVDIRKFLSRFWDSDITSGFRNVMDSRDISFRRMAGVEYFRRLNGISFTDALPAFWDIVYYHTNHAQMSDPTAWKMSGNSIPWSASSMGLFKGYYVGLWGSDVQPFPRDYTFQYSETQAPLFPAAEEAFRDLLAYCDEHSLPLLVTSSPYYALRQDIEEINTFAGIADEYGVTLLNMNTEQRWAEINIDPSRDFVDLQHLNTFGTQKYTDYLLRYIAETYDLEDHRGNAGYAFWDEAYGEYRAQMDEMQQYTRSVIARLDRSEQDEMTMRETEDPTEWFSLINSTDMTFLISASGLSDYADTPQLSFLLRGLGIGSAEINEAGTLVGKNSHDGIFVDTTSPNHADYLLLTAQAAISYTLSAGPISTITFGDKVYSYESDGIHLIAVDRYSGAVFDSVTIGINEDQVFLTHEPLI